MARYGAEHLQMGIYDNIFDNLFYLDKDFAIDTQREDTLCPILWYPRIL